MIKVALKLFALLLGFTLLNKRDQWPAGATDSAPVSPGRAPDASLLGLDDNTRAIPTYNPRPISADPALAKPARYRFRATIETDNDTYHLDVEGSAEFVRMMSTQFASTSINMDSV